MNSTTSEIQPTQTYSVVSQEDTVIKDEAYTALLDEMNAIKVEFAYQRNVSLCDQHWHWGEAINDYQKLHRVGVSAFIRELKNDLKISERSLWFAKKAADTYPTIDIWHNALPDGKATSWTKAKALLGDTSSQTASESDLNKVAMGIIKRHGIEDAKDIARIILAHIIDPQA